MSFVAFVVHGCLWFRNALLGSYYGSCLWSPAWCACYDTIRAAERRLRTTRLIAKALKSRHHPILAQIVPTRRCNLACAYCNEFDKVSAPVPLEVMLDRIDRLAALGTTMIDLSGGEPMLHPELDAIIERIRRHGILAGLLTNGYLLTPERIKQPQPRRTRSAANQRGQRGARSGVAQEPQSIGPKLCSLAQLATFDVNINTVVGAGIRHPQDALVIAKRAQALGFGTSVGLIHGESGQIVPLDPARIGLSMNRS